MKYHPYYNLNCKYPLEYIIHSLSGNPKAISIIYQFQEYIDWELLSINPEAIELIEKNLDKINWHTLSKNPNAIKILEKHQDKINWFYLSKNPNAIELLKQNPNKINWYYLSKNPNAIELLEKNIQMIDWNFLSENPNAIKILEKNINKINWFKLFKNPNAFHLIDSKINECILNKNKDLNSYLFCLLYNPNPLKYKYINNYLNHLKTVNENSEGYWFYDEILEDYYSIWYQLSSNETPEVLELLSNHLKELNWNAISKNPKAINLIKNNFNKTNIFLLCNYNENVIDILFNYNYEYMRKHQSQLHSELVKKTFDPKRILNLSKLFNISFNDYLHLLF
jgi:hypothetical protein